ncbi:MAG: putative endonuclease [Parcubacteria group bacterium Gr01-1014_2]|nr:MAG: putative endonuclease [Parcubacteria group bacterium Gr01-1014_2]
MYFVYMLKNSKGKLYVGITTNLKNRTYYHNTGQGAQFTKSKSKFILVFQEEYKTLKEARKREIQIKKWRRDKKEMLIKRFQKDLSTKL